MIALYCTGGFFALLFLLLLCPVSLRFLYRGGGIKASGHYLFFRFDFSPERLGELASRQADEGEREGKKPKKKKTGPPKPKKGGTLQFAWSLVQAAKWHWLRRHLVFYKVEVYASIGGCDAHDAAVRYGNINAAVYALLTTLRLFFPVKKPVVHMAPDFLSGEDQWDIAFRIKIRPWFVLVAAVHTLSSFAGMQRRRKNRRNNDKGGKNYEPTAASHQ